jgi:hypothetical protein
MRRTTLTAVLTAGVMAAGVMAGLAPAAQAAANQAAATPPAARAAATRAAGHAPAVGPAFHGRVTFTIYSSQPDPTKPPATARGAIKAKGHFYRRSATLAFPKGRIIIHRRSTGVRYSGPYFPSCRLTITQRGTFSIVKGTGRYRGLRGSGTFRTIIHERLRSLGGTTCGTKYVYFHAVTYETGSVR